MARRKRSSAKSSRRRSRPILWFNLLLLIALGCWYALQPPARRAEVNHLLRNSIEREKHIEPLDIVWDIYQLYYSPDFVAAPPAPGDHTYVYAGIPAATGANSRTGGLRLLPNQGYLVGYDDSLPAPRWAAYHIKDITPIPKPSERPDSFAADPRTVSRITSDTYTGTGYDRGHLAPNYAIATRYGDAAQRETFLLSNIIPQKHGLNAGLWKQLETNIATSYPARFGEVWVIVGPVFSRQPPQTLGRGGPALPESCYMIILDESDGRLRTMAFVFPQDATGPLDHYLTTIDSIETRTGLDFFSALEDTAENQLESTKAARVW